MTDPLRKTQLPAELEEALRDHGVALSRAFASSVANILSRLNEVTRQRNDARRERDALARQIEELRDEVAKARER
jgi:chromosome segregation ATPase